MCRFEGKASRYVNERDLRALSTRELIDLIHQDIRTLDQAWRERRRKAQPAAVTQMDWEPDPEPIPLHAVSCCGSTLGRFPAKARVRCPFCQTWHQAGSESGSGGW